MKKLLSLLTGIFLLSQAPLLAQVAPNHTIPVNRGPGVSGMGNLGPAALDTTLVGAGSGYDPLWVAITSCNGTNTALNYATGGVFSCNTGVGNTGTVNTWTQPQAFSASISSASALGAIAYGTLPYTDINIFASFNANVNNYDQVVVSNSNAGAVASADYVVSNNLGTGSTYFGDFGMNSSGFTGSGSWNLPNAVFLTSSNGDLAIGTLTSNAIHFFTNSGTTDAGGFSSTGVFSLGTPLAVGSGGTGVGTFTQYGVLYGNNTGAVTATAVGTAGQALLSVGGIAAPAFGTLNLASTTNVTGALGVANGGTGLASYTIGDLPYASASTTISKLADVATGSVLVSGGVGAAPAYSATPTVTSITAATVTANTTVSGTGFTTYLASPPAIGGTTAAAGTFTALTASGAIVHNTTTNNQSYTTSGAGTITITSGTAGSINNMSIGATTAGTGAFTTLSASSTVSGTGFSTYLASPPAIGGTAAAAGSFTTLGASSTVTLSPAYANVVLSPTGTGVVTISPATAGTINNVSIGATTASTGKFTTITETNLLVSNAAPTISSGFGTSPSVTANNGTAAFRINVGTGATASSGVIGLPTATTGWNCWVQDFTTPATTFTKVSASTTTTVTVTNYNTTGVATAWAASDILQVSCFAY